MSIFNIGKKKESTIPTASADKPTPKVAAPKKTAAKAEVKAEAKKAPVESRAGKAPLKGTSINAYRTLIKPLVTEKAAALGTHRQYIFMVEPRMNKIEVKKAVRTIYGVDPTKVNMIAMMGKAVRYGKTSGRTKHWKKAIVTLKAGDTIEVYEGV